MTRGLFALIWLGVVVLAGGYLAGRVTDGLRFRTDLMALLPREEQDPVLQHANDAVSGALARRVVVLVGHAGRAQARDAALRLASDLAGTGLVEPIEGELDANRMARLGSLYFPHRHGLLADADRAVLVAGRGHDIATRALAQAYGGIGGIDAGLLRADPFLLLPSFFAAMPIPLSRLAPDDGMLSVAEAGITWVLVNVTLKGDPLELDTQERLVGAFDAAVAGLGQTYPGLQVKRLGAVFFAHAGARTAMAETSVLGLLGLGGTILLIVAVFRRAGPLLYNVLALGVGIGMGFASSLALFGELHVAALLFGTSLIGVAIDYGLHYSACLFNAEATPPRERLRQVLPGITLGLLTTLIGYGGLLLAPFPGLRQIAVFSSIGLIAAFLTVVLWLPWLDRGRPIGHGRRLCEAAGGLWVFWTGRRFRAARAALLILAAALGTAGLAHLHSDDDVRRLQSLSPDLLREQGEIQALIGAGTATQFLLVQAGDDEAALRIEESLADRLTGLRRDGVLAGYQMPTAFIPSAERQFYNRTLVRTALEEPLLAAQLAQLGLPTPIAGAEDGQPVLTLDRALEGAGLPFLRDLVLAPGLHIVALQGITRIDAVRSAVSGIAGVRLVDPVNDFSELLGKYRQRALVLAGFGAVAMLLLLVWRYGWRGGFWTMLPPATAVVLTPALLALTGQGITFFHAMALLLILSIEVDYAIFCAESTKEHRSVALVAIWLAVLTTLLSFGLLAFSSVRGVQSFGLTMLIGVSFSFLLAPLAGRANKCFGEQEN
jgi:predicted exporter